LRSNFDPGDQNSLATEAPAETSTFDRESNSFEFFLGRFYISLRSNFDPGDQNSLETEAPAEASKILLGISLLDLIRVGLFFWAIALSCRIFYHLPFRSLVHCIGLFSIYLFTLSKPF